MAGVESLESRILLIGPPPMALGDFVWNDLNANGQQEAGEPGIGGVTVKLLDAGNNVLATTTTDGNGAYAFNGLFPGTYHVQFATPSGFTATTANTGNDATDSDAVGGVTGNYTLSPGQIDNTVDAGFYKPVTVGNFVWNDLNANGVQNAGEPGIAGVTLTLTGTTGSGASVTHTATTDANGFYSFTEMPGTYSVAVTTPGGYTPTVTGQGTTATDSNSTPSGTTPAFLLGGGSDLTLDFGFYQPVTIGNFVWNDLNANGVQNAGESGIAGVTLTLTGTTGSGAAVTHTATTDANGFYSFTEMPGTYSVAVTAPSGFTPTATGQGTTATDSNSTPSGTTPAFLLGGGSDLTLDFGFYQPVTVGNFVWNDLNANGVQEAGEPGIQGVTLTLTGTTGSGAAVTHTATTDVNGFYSFTEMPGTYSVAVTAPGGYTPTATGQGTTATDSNSTPSGTTPTFLLGGGSDLTLDFGFYRPAALGNFVWNDLNANGQQDGGEPGILGATVNLLDAGNNVVATTTTNASGLYQFSNLTPGTYTVQFLTPGGYLPTTANAGNDVTDSDAVSGVTGPYTLISGQIDNTVDAGFYLPAALGDFVWNDLNANGQQDAGEPGLPGVTVNLLDAGNNVVATTTTNASGVYNFTGLNPGTYTVQFATPSGFTPTAADTGNDATDSDALSGVTGPYSLTPGQVNNTVDAGFYQQVTIGDFVWNDLNANGVQDAGELGIAGVTLTLTGTTGSGAPVSHTTTTDANGFYSFSEVPGTYSVAVTTPSGFTPTVTGQGTAATDSNATPSGTTPVALPGGGSDQTLDFGFYQPVTIGNFVWNDLNANGVQDAGEPGIAGVTVTLTGTTGSDVAVGHTTTTDANGFYSFTEAPGTYTVAVTTPSGYTPTVTGQGTNATDSNATPSGTTPVALPGGASDQTLDFGFYQPVTIGNFVWNDLNANGVQDAGEPGLAGVTLTLTGTTGSGAPVSDTTTTDANGFYNFTEVPGTYTVAVTTPSGFTPTVTGAGTTATDSNATPSGTTPVALPGGGSDQTLDFGFYQPVTIGNFVWNDLNANGVQDAGEPGIAGVTLTLTGTTGSGAPVSDTTTTDANGFYNFTEVPGTYTVAVTTPSGYTPTVTGQGTTATDSNATPSGTTPVALPGGGSDQTLDFGFYLPAALGDFVWNDLNANGQQDSGEAGISGVTVKLLDAGNNVVATTTTDGNGAYSFTGLVPGTYTVQFVTPAGYTPTTSNNGNDATDSDAVAGVTGPYTLISGQTDNTVDAGFYLPAALGDFVWNDLNANGQQDSGEAGISGVTVKLLDAGNSVVATTTTNGSGAYAFTGLKPGTYSVQFATPAGYTPTTANTGSDATDSDAAAGGLTGPYTLISGQTNNTVDAGFYLPAALGDFVWNDLNANGQQDSGEAGISGVTVKLLDAGNNVVATTTTNGSGVYAFTGLKPGTYSVQFVTPSGYTPTTANTGNDASDSDAVSGVTGSYTLISGQTNNTVDAGFYRPAALGDFVWNDLNANGQQDTNEPGISGVTVTLLDAGNNVVGTTTTNASGAYAFTGLKPGTYSVQFATPAGYTATTANTGNDATDSDAVSGVTGQYTLIAGQTNNTIDAGFFRPGSISGTKYLDVSGNGLTDDDTVMAGATFSLYRDGNGNGVLDGADGAAIKTATSLADGTFGFTNLVAGVYFVSENAMAGYVRTGPTLANYYTVNVTAGSQNGGLKFANAVACGCDTSSITNIKYIINGTTTVTDLRGKVNQGDTVEVQFDVVRAGGTFTLVSYVAPGAAFDANNASLQTIFDTDQVTNAAVGRYTLKVLVPNCWFQVDFVCGQAIDKFGPAGSNIFYSAQNRLLSADNDGSCAYAASSLSGYVYVDGNNNGVKESGEAGIAGVTLNLAGVDIFGNSVSLTTTTNSSGYYQFGNLVASGPAGYKITEVQPTTYLDGKDAVGSLGGTLGNDVLSAIKVNTNKTGTNYNFGEIVACVTAGDFATIGYWKNNNGQALLKSLNGGPNSTALASWLASTFPNLYGAGAGARSMLNSNGTPKTNSQVAALYLGNCFFGASGQKTDAQILAAAFGVYVTSTGLAGANTAAGSYGFNVSSSGSGTHTYNVGSNGAAFGVANNTVLTVNQILAWTNSKASGGSLYGGSTSLINAANTVYNGINTSGDITMVAAGSTAGQNMNLALVSTLNSLTTGEILVAVDELSADQGAAELAVINAAIQSLNDQLGVFQVHLTMATGDAASLADIHVRVSDTSEIGGVAEGVLGVTSGTDITLISGWNWYLGDTTTTIQGAQFDFQTVVTHELVHALGLGHSTDTTSVMFPELAAGVVRHTLTAGDLAMIGQVEDHDEGPEALMAVQPVSIEGSVPVSIGTSTTAAILAASRPIAATPGPVLGFVSSTSSQIAPAPASPAIVAARTDVGGDAADIGGGENNGITQQRAVARGASLRTRASTLGVSSPAGFPLTEIALSDVDSFFSQVGSGAMEFESSGNGA